MAFLWKTYEAGFLFVLLKLMQVVLKKLQGPKQVEKEGAWS